ncbi:putative sugar lactone lactonase YvrE [Zeugodacus cucurbitae]|uniref:putative sugar lactone lactonase YvrE n=1 Tax=Zeugodacus cucurbitae TaxID=28588 RepID=UPI0010A74E33|nr:putative sugar lactone lactonase YvrE [Zeugodacus cucurbitae]
MGEGPHWKYPNLYYVDLDTGEVVRYDSITRRTYKCQIINHRRVSFIIPYKNSDKLFAVGLNHLAAQIYWDGYAKKCHVVKKLFEVETTNPRDINNCLNDAKCDAKGRLFTGTGNCDFANAGVNDHGPHRNLYKFANGKLERILANVNLSNGMAWNYTRNEYYYIDSGRNDIIQFDYDLKSGRTVNPNVVFHLDVSEFPPNHSGWIVMDGMTQDTSGYLYVVVFGSNKILKICTRKWTIVERIETPCRFISSATFGGAKRNELYVTSVDLTNGTTPCGEIFRISGFTARGVPNEPIEL